LRHGNAWTDESERNSTPPYQQYPSYTPTPETTSAPQYGSDGGATEIQHRLSNKERPLSPELLSPGLESVWQGESEKEVAYPPPQPLPYQRPEEPPAKKRICGMPSTWFFALIGFLLIVAIALGVGLGLGLGTKKHS